MERGHNLKERWDVLKKEAAEKKIRLFSRDAAKKLKVSEADLIATQCGGVKAGGSIRLLEDWPKLLEAMIQWGQAKFITRNDAAVLENTDSIEKIDSHKDEVMSLYGKQNTLRCFLKQWKYAFAVSTEIRPGVMRESIQIYDKHGDAALKAFISEPPDSFQKFKEAFKNSDQSTELFVENKSEPSKDRPSNPFQKVDKTSLETDWRSLKEVDAFPKLLSAYGLSKYEACEFVDNELAQKVSAKMLVELLREVASRELEIIALVENPGALQIYKGALIKFRRIDTWANILDPGVNIHIRTDLVKDGFILNRPQLTRNQEGQEQLHWQKTSHFFDHQGHECMSFSQDGKSHPSQSSQWEELLEKLEKPFAFV